VGGKDVNLEMVKAVTEVYRGTPAAGFDNTAYWKAEGKARTAKKGVWAQGDKYMSPRQWRRVNSGK